LAEIGSDPALRREYEKERAISDVTEMIYFLMEEQNISKAQLATKMRTTGANITQLLNGTRNMTIATVTSILFCLGSSFELGWRSLKPLSVANLEAVSWAGADSAVWRQELHVPMWSVVMPVKMSSSDAEPSDSIAA
jgi:plasmid maintenance system antidote protein VapI